MIPEEAIRVTIWVQHFNNRLSLLLAVVKKVILMIARVAAFWIGILVLKSDLHNVVFGFSYVTGSYL
jgi:hypothetical protein